MRSRLGSIIVACGDSGDIWFVQESMDPNDGHQAIAATNIQRLDNHAMDRVPYAMQKAGFSLSTASAPVFITCLASMLGQAYPGRP